MQLLSHLQTAHTDKGRCSRPEVRPPTISEPRFSPNNVAYANATPPKNFVQQLRLKDSWMGPIGEMVGSAKVPNIVAQQALAAVIFLLRLRGSHFGQDQVW